MNVTSEKDNKLSMKRIKLQEEFNNYTNENGFSYAEWLNPPAGSFYETYKKELDEINAKIAPELNYND